MWRLLSTLPLVLFPLAALLRNAAAGESLAIQRTAATEIWIGAHSPPEIGFRLQASADFQEWTDISDQVSGPMSYRIENTGGSPRFFRLKTWSIPETPVILALIGDSTVADFEINQHWFCGWGQGLYGSFKSNVRVINLAAAGASTKIYLTSDQMRSLVRLEPDFVLIHFGSVDVFGLGGQYHTTLKEFETNLNSMVRAIRDFKGTPILVTPAVPRIFGVDKKVGPSMEDRRQAMKGIAAESQTYLIDLNQLSRDLFNELGEAPSRYISWSEEDPVHFSFKGAEVIAGLVVKALPDILRPYVVKRLIAQNQKEP